MILQIHSVTVSNNSSVMIFFLVFAFFTALTCSGFGSEAKISFDARIKPFFQEHCLKCHGKNDKIKGKLDLREYNNHTDFLNDAEKIEDIISVILLSLIHISEPTRPY